MCDLLVPETGRPKMQSNKAGGRIGRTNCLCIRMSSVFEVKNELAYTGLQQCETPLYTVKRHHLDIKPTVDYKHNSITSNCCLFVVQQLNFIRWTTKSRQFKGLGLSSLTCNSEQRQPGLALMRGALMNSDPMHFHL